MARNQQSRITEPTEKEIVDTNKYAQLTIALKVESREKVDEIVNTAASLGGKIITEPED